MTPATKVRLEQIIELTHLYDHKLLWAIRELAEKTLVDERESDRKIVPLYQYMVGEPEYWH